MQNYDTEDWKGKFLNKKRDCEKLQEKLDSALSEKFSLNENLKHVESNLSREQRKTRPIYSKETDRMFFRAQHPHSNSRNGVDFQVVFDVKNIMLRVYQDRHDLQEILKDPIKFKCMLMESLDRELEREIIRMSEKVKHHFSGNK